MTRLSNAFGRLLNALAVARGADAARHGRHGHGRHHPPQPHAHRLPLGQRSLRIRALRHHAADRAVAVAPRPACADRSRAHARPGAAGLADGGRGRRRRLRRLSRHDALRPQDDDRQRHAGLDHHQEPGVPGMVAAVAAAGLLCVAGRRIRLPLRPADPQRARPPRRSDLGRAEAHELGRSQHHPVRRPRRADEPRAVGRVRLPRHQHRRGAACFSAASRGCRSLRATPCSR